MSKPGVKIYFDDPPLRPDVVSFAVAPMDAFSGRLVTSGVKAKVKDLPDHAIRNLSGHLVFKNLPKALAYTVIVDPAEAGYFAPEDSVFPNPNDPETSKTKLHPVRLIRRPEFPFAGTTTLIRGVVVRGAEAVEGATIWVAGFKKATDPSFEVVAAEEPLRFETRSGNRGAFALPLALPLSDTDAKVVPVSLHLKHGRDIRVLENLQINDGKSHSFCEPIDLTGTNKPGFFPCPEPGGVT